MDVIGVGALNLDFIYEMEDLVYLKVAGIDTVAGQEIICRESILEGLRDTMSRFGTLKKVSPGGSASNTCHVFSRMGFDTGLIGVLGEDKEGDFYLQQLPYAGRSVVARRGRSGMAYIINTRKRDRSIIVIPNSNSDLFSSDINDDYLEKAKWIHMSSYVKKEGVATQMEIRRRMAGRACFSIDLGEIYAGMGETIYPLIDGTEILFMTEKEIEILFGDDMDKAIGTALGMAKIFVVKKGKNGASLYTKETRADAKSEWVHVVDNTGAGDVLDGVLIGLYMKGEDLAHALRVAVWAASQSTTEFGRDAYPDMKTIGRLLSDHGT